MIVTVTANPSVDRTYRLRALQPGELNRATSGWVEASGAGVNVGLVLRRLGVPARMIVTAGGSEGRQLGDLLSATGFDKVIYDGGDWWVRRHERLATFTLVPVRGATRVNVTHLVDGAAPTRINEPGTMLVPEEVDRVVAATGAVLATGRVSWLACCGSLPVGTDPGLVRRLVEAAHAAGVPVAVDASGPALATAVASRADLLKPNREELAEVAGRPIDSLTDAITAAREIRSRSGGTVLASLGADGAVLVTATGGWHAAAPHINPVNTTGAGDALLAGYLADTAADPPVRLAHAVAIGVSSCLAQATADLAADLVDPARVRVRALTEDAFVSGGR